MSVAARAVSVEQIAIVDFAPFLSGSTAARRRVAEEVARACETIGFLYLKNHGIPDGKMAAIFDAARALFNLPAEVRNQQELLCSPTVTRGYMPLQSRHYPGTGAPDLMEAFKFQQELAPDDPDAVLERMAAEETRIVSLTITEGGYGIDDTTGEFDLDAPDVAADLERGATPRTTFGIVTEALRRRRDFDIGDHVDRRVFLRTCRRHGERRKRHRKNENELAHHQSLPTPLLCSDRSPVPCRPSKPGTTIPRRTLSSEAKED